MRKYFFQDVCRAITKGRWKFPKHILLATTLVTREFRPVFECAADSLEPIHIASRVGPSFTSEAVFETPTASHFEHNNSLKINRTWILSRIMGSNYCEQSVSGFGGFVSAVGEKPKRGSTIDYFVPIDLPFTNYSTIRELLRRSEEATNEVGQK